MRKRGAAHSATLAILSAVAAALAIYLEDRSAYRPIDFAINFTSTRQFVEPFRPEESVQHEIVLDLGCGGPSDRDDARLDPSASQLPFSWRVLDHERVTAEGRLGSYRLRHWDSVARRELGQRVGVFDANRSHAYEIVFHVGEFDALTKCSPRAIVEPVADAVVGLRFVARSVLVLSTVLAAASLYFLGRALARRFRTRVP